MREREEDNERHDVYAHLSMQTQLINPKFLQTIAVEHRNANKRRLAEEEQVKESQQREEKRDPNARYVLRVSS